MPFVTREKEFKIVVGFLLLGISLLWIYKFPYLGLPYFWDEGWSYATAVYRMSTQNLCLLPSCLDPELSRGHPLLFYFMNAAVAKVFGFSPLVMHAFSLIVASVTLVVFFFILLRFTNPVFALLGTWLLLVQEVFLVQSSFLLPEVFISLLIIITIYFLFAGKTWWYIITASLLVLTKESGMVVVTALYIANFSLQLKQQLKGPNKSYHRLITYHLLLSIPLIIGIAFYLIQKWTYGWYFYPVHIGMMNFDWSVISNHLLLIRMFIFSGYGREHLSVIMGIFILLIIISMLWQQKKIEPGIFRITFFLLIVFVSYSLFSSVNYISLRYLIPLVQLFIFLLVIWGYQLYVWGFRYTPYLFYVSIAFALYHDSTSNSTWIDDVSIHYTDNAEIGCKAVEFMEEKQAHSKKIWTTYTISHDLTHPELACLNGPPFTNVMSDTLVNDADYYIFVNFPLIEACYDQVKMNDSLVLEKRWEKGYAWCEVYARK
ncbi:MAG: glycosyltransferase family 39 protein [Chitinophagales bacterium]|nr:glycosyltransferase family 39 protein [Chitinophagales bacterium]